VVTENDGGKRFKATFKAYVILRMRRYADMVFNTGPHIGLLFWRITQYLS